MEKQVYDYRKEVANDVKDLLVNDLDNHSEIKKAIDDYKNDEIDFYDLCNTLYDELFIIDGITGNASGSYTFNEAQAKEYVLQNIELVIEAAKEFDYSLDSLYEKGYEGVDVILRCYVLYECVEKVLKELYGEKLE